MENPRFFVHKVERKKQTSDVLTIITKNSILNDIKHMTSYNFKT